MGLLVHYVTAVLQQPVEGRQGFKLIGRDLKRCACRLSAASFLIPDAMLWLSRWQTLVLRGRQMRGLVWKTQSCGTLTAMPPELITQDVMSKARHPGPKPDTGCCDNF